MQTIRWLNQKKEGNMICNFKFFGLTIFMLTIAVALHSCQGLVDIDEYSEVDFIETFKSQLQETLGKASDIIDKEENPSVYIIQGSLKTAYKDVFGDYTNIDQFSFEKKELNNSLRLDSNSQSMNLKHNSLQMMIKNSDSSEEFINKLEGLLSNSNLEEKERLNYIALKETISFFDKYHEIVSNSINPSLVVNSSSDGEGDSGSGDGGDSGGSDSDAQDDEGWWETWGRCAVGTIGGYYTGALAGCGIVGGVGAAIGGPPGAAGGCAVGVIVGAIGGALTGAATFC